MALTIGHVGIVGAGLMGSGIALSFTLGGYSVSLSDLDERTLDSARARIDSLLTLLQRHGVVDRPTAMAVPDLIEMTTSIEETAERAGFVVEAVVEDLGVKQRVFADLEENCMPNTVLTSNTSSFTARQISEQLKEPERVVVANWWNPPYLLPLVEVVGTDGTSSEAIDTTVEVLNSIGKQPVVLTKESVGFVGNRLQFALLREAMSIVEAGVSSPEDIDKIVSYGFARRLATVGLFQTFDLAGWDTISRVADEIFPTLNTRHDGSPMIRGMVGAGRLGVKTGGGVYEWDERSAGQLEERLILGLAALNDVSDPGRWEV